MAPKTVKTKRPTTAKKTTVKKTAAKKPTVKATAAPVVAPAPEMHGCACGASCKCHACKCGSKFGRFVKKLFWFAIIFALGFVAAKFCCCGPKHPMMRGPRVHFVNGCVDVASVKCPKLAEALPAMDINGDGCITREEYRAVKKKMRHEIREMNVQEVE